MILTVACADPTVGPDLSLPTVTCDTDGTIETFAGTGEWGGSGDGGPATEATFDFPVRVTLDTEGNLYVVEHVEFGPSRVRRIDDQGLIATVAGPPTGEEAPQPWGEPEFEAYGLVAFAVASSGDMYFGGGLHDNNVILRIDPSGEVSRFAGSGVQGYGGDGGPALEARFAWITDIVPSDNGVFYIVDHISNRIRAIDRDGVVSTIAGGGKAGDGGDGGPADEAQLNEPFGAAIGPDGSLYIADTGGSRIRRIDAEGIISTVAGTGNPGGRGDGGPAVDADLLHPEGVWVDAEGRIFIADTGNHRIRCVDTDGNIDTVAGTGYQGSTGDGGPATQAALHIPVDVVGAPDGVLYIADAENVRVRVVR
jgi:hypothetical protein